MTTDQIDKMIEQCVCHSAISTSRDQLRALVRVAVEAERAACEQIANDRCQADHSYRNELDWRQPYAANRVIRASMDIAAAIRNRKHESKGGA